MVSAKPTFLSSLPALMKLRSGAWEHCAADLVPNLPEPTAPTTANIVPVLTSIFMFLNDSAFDAPFCPQEKLPPTTVTAEKLWSIGSFSTACGSSSAAKKNSVNRPQAILPYNNFRCRTSLSLVTSNTWTRRVAPTGNK